MSPYYLLTVHMLTSFQKNTLNTNLLYLYMGIGNPTTEPAQILKKVQYRTVIFLYFHHSLAHNDTTQYSLMHELKENFQICSFIQVSLKPV